MTVAARSLAALALLSLGLLGGCIGRVTDSPAPVDQTSPGRWTQTTPMPTARQEVAAAAFGGRVWVMGGFGSNAEPVATVETFDPALGLCNLPHFYTSLAPQMVRREAGGPDDVPRDILEAWELLETLVAQMRDDERKARQLLALPSP